MKNVKVYDYFFKYSNASFVIRSLKISLARTFIFNLNNKDIYFRKDNILRKMVFSGKERAFLMDSKSSFNDFEYAKYGMNSIEKLIREYVYIDKTAESLKETCFDIVEKKKNTFMTSDSFFRKVRRDELVTMCFDDNNYYDNVNI